jgi:hypothetical protein
MTHVRTQTEKSSAGWSGDEVIRFIEDHAGMEAAPTAAPAVVDQPAAGRAAAAPARRPSRVHTAVLDAGKAIGGTSRDIELDLATETVGDVPELEYQATLSGRPFGQAGEPSSWTTLARRAGRLSVSDHLPLRFSAVALPPGIQRLRVEVALRLPEPSEDGPKLDPADPVEGVDVRHPQALAGQQRQLLIGRVRGEVPAVQLDGVPGRRPARHRRPPPVPPPGPPTGPG